MGRRTINRFPKPISSETNFLPEQGFEIDSNTLNYFKYAGSSLIGPKAFEPL
jgi:hypothetical protein